MSLTFRLLTESDVKAVLTMDDLIETMASALQRFSSGRVAQPVRTVIPVDRDDAFVGFMPAFVRGAVPEREASPAGRSAAGAKAAAERPSLGAKIVTVFGSNAARGLHTHLASIVLLDPETGALLALLDGRYITEARTAAVSAVSSRLLARPTASSLAIIGSGVQARSHLDALSRVHKLKHVEVWSPNRDRREQFVAKVRDDLKVVPYDEKAAGHDAHAVAGHDLQAHTVVGQDLQVLPILKAVDHAGEAVVGADVIVLATASPTPVIESGWVKPGAHVISVGACRPTQREMDPALVARARLYVDSRAAALVESGDVVMGIQEGRFGPEHIVAEIGELVGAGHGNARGDEHARDVTIFKSLGLAVEDVTAADLAYRRALERGLGKELSL